MKSEDSNRYFLEESEEQDWHSLNRERSKAKIRKPKARDWDDSGMIDEWDGGGRRLSKRGARRRNRNRVDY